MKHPLSLRGLDPFGLPAFGVRPSLFGTPVVIEQPRPRYVLPDDVPPPTGMTREEFAAWSVRVCGYAPPFLKDGDVMTLSGALHMNQATFNKLQAHIEGQARRGR